MAAPIERITGKTVNPIGRYVLIEIDKVDKKTFESGILEIPDEVIAKYQYSESTGVIRGIGELAYGDHKTPPKVGDHVMFNTYSGLLIRVGNEEDQYTLYRILKDMDVICTILN